LYGAIGTNPVHRRAELAGGTKEVIGGAGKCSIFGMFPMIVTTSALRR